MIPTPKQMMQAAEDYCSRGMFVIPAHRPEMRSDGTVTCSCGTQHAPGKQGKHPAVGWKRFQNTRPSAGEVRRWWQGRYSGYNIAAIHGATSGTILLDTDGMEGFASLRELERELGELPPTPTVLTGGGGSHQLFRHTGVYIPTRKGLRDSFDVRGDGGISVLPPSVHEFGGYQWECDRSLDDLPYADLPQTWSEFITQPFVETPKPIATSSKQSYIMPNVQWQPAPDGSMLVTDGREEYMRGVVWRTLMQMLQDNVLVTADSLYERAAPAYLPNVDLSRSGHGEQDLYTKCRAAAAKSQLLKASQRGLTKPFLTR